MKRASVYPLISRIKFPLLAASAPEVSQVNSRIISGGGKWQSGPAGFAVEVPGMSIVGVFERRFALDERLGFRT